MHKKMKKLRINKKVYPIDSNMAYDEEEITHWYNWKYDTWYSDSHSTSIYIDDGVIYAYN